MNPKYRSITHIKTAGIEIIPDSLYWLSFKSLPKSEEVKDAKTLFWNTDFVSNLNL